MPLKYEIDFRNYMSRFDFPDMATVSTKLDAVFVGQDFILQELKGHLTGVFVIYPERVVENLPPITFTKRIRFSKETEEVEVLVRKVTYVPRQKKKRDRDRDEDNPDQVDTVNDNPNPETLITIVQCCVEEGHKALDQILFDQAFIDLGFAIVKPCAYQFNRESRRQNGNRFLVVQAPQGHDGAIPGTIQVVNKTTNIAYEFHTRYRGQKWKCRRCLEEHVGACPSIKAFYELQEQRRLEKINISIVTDSTLRHADCIGTRADITCVPGDRVGELLNAAVDDPSLEHKKNIIIMGGHK